MRVWICSSVAVPRPVTIRESELNWSSSHGTTACDPEAVRSSCQRSSRAETASFRSDFADESCLSRSCDLAKKITVVANMPSAKTNKTTRLTIMPTEFPERLAITEALQGRLAA